MILTEAYIDELVAFAGKNSKTAQHSSTLIKRFLSELISTKELVFDLEDSKGRMAVAVLLDKVNNPANDSCLEILAMRADVDSSQVIFNLIEMAKAHPTMKRSGFQIGFHQDSLISDNELNQLGLTHYYDTYEMLHSDLVNVVLKDETNIIEAVLADQDELYQVLCESFAQNPDISIPDKVTWDRNFLKSDKSHFYLYRSNNKILGFSNLIEDEEESEIRTLGVLSSARGKGIGKILLHHSLRQSSKLGFSTCRLTVAVTNEKALSMYSQAGFQIVEKLKTFRIDFL